MMVRQAGNIPSDRAKCVRDGTANRGMPSIYEKQVYDGTANRGMPAIYEKQVYDGTADRAFAINLRKVHLRWYESVNIYHQTIKWKFTMAR
jgi:hypothetical protein